MTINVPKTITFSAGTGSGVINGSGIIKFTSPLQAGSLTVNIPEIHLTGGFQGTIIAHKIILDSEQDKYIYNADITADRVIVNGITAVIGNSTINGPLLISPGVELANHVSSDAALTVNGDVENNGLIRNRGWGHRFILNISGNIKNKGTWVNGRTYLIWAPIPGADSYEFNIADNQNNWPAPITMDVNSFNITAYLYNEGYWRVRPVFTGLPGNWSEVRAINGRLETERNPVIIVPGIMGSWSVNGEWKLDPILHTYDDLWEALKRAGYVEGKTLFAFPYQWRNSNIISAGQLKNKINEVKNICECGKVDIVAHSMGGLVVRYYVEGDDYESDIDRIVFLGTPHRGAPKAYLMWEGEKFIGMENIMKKYFSIEAHLMGYDSLFTYIQNRIKSVEQLLPDYAYLQNTGSTGLRKYDFIRYPHNYPYNSFLEYLNSTEKLNNFANSGVDILNIAGNTGDNTIGVINVSLGKQYYPLWEHGIAEELSYLSGDNTVPLMSTTLFDTKILNKTQHKDLPAKTQKQVIEFLTGEIPADPPILSREIQKVLLLGIYSPADFVIISPSGQRLGKDFVGNTSINEIARAFYTGFADEPEFAVIINPEEGDYKVELQGTDSGEYKLELNYFDEEQEISKEFTGSIRAGEKYNFDFTYNEGAEDYIGKLEPNDNMPPSIVVNSPAKNGRYLHNGNLIIDYTVVDDFSGVSSTVIKIDERILTVATADLFYYDLGEHILNITAIDNMGNSTSSTVKFAIITNIDNTIGDIERSYNLGWVKKKYVEYILTAGLKIIEKRLTIFDKQKKHIEKQKQKIIDNPDMPERIKEGIITRMDKRLERTVQQRKKFIRRSLTALTKIAKRFYRKNLINRQGCDIIKNDTEYLKINLE